MFTMGGGVVFRQQPMSTWKPWLFPSQSLKGLACATLSLLMPKVLIIPSFFTQGVLLSLGQSICGFLTSQDLCRVGAGTVFESTVSS